MPPQSVRTALPPIAAGIGPGPRPPLARAARGRPATAGAGPDTWSTYWREFALENAPHERCHVPGDGRTAVDRHWAHFADGLPGGAHVLDLGCGAGIAGRTLLDRRSDLRVTGVDWASVPIAHRPNLEILPRVRMEALPFDHRCFDAAISLFGIEYGDIEQTARELVRVLKPDARFGFLVHHCDSEIPREGGVRRRALRELIGGSMKGAFLAGSVARIDRQRLQLRKRFPEEPMVALVSDHFRRNAGRSRADRLRLWQELADDLQPEIALLIQLERSAKSATEMGTWLVPLLSTMKSVGVSVLRRASGEPIAWDVRGIK